MGGLKLLLASAVALLAIGLAACGDGDDATSTTTPADSKGAQEKSKPANDNSQDKSKKDGDENKDGSSDDSSKSTSERGKDIGNFVPKQHEDSGGGAEQFEAKGGDNSVQEFGEEATGSDFEEASTALHNFLDARAVGDWTAACDYLAADVIKSLQTLASQTKESKGASCGELLGNLANKAALPLLRKEAEKADVGSLRTEGDQSFIIYRGLEGDILAMSMTKEEDGWKVASLGGTPLN